MSAIKRAIALGFFDGIHIGHAALLRRLVDVSNEKVLIPAVISFDTLPQNVLSNKNTPLINTKQDKNQIILQKFKVYNIIYLPFDENTAQTSWEVFLDKLIAKYGACHLIVGKNFKFGKNAAGTSELLKTKCESLNIGCDIIDDVTYDGIVCSSTYIRQLLTAGDIKRANDFLGHEHVFTGVVIEGKKLGTKLGIPTINMCIPQGIIVPKYGVYVTKVTVETDCCARQCSMPAVTNIGVRPTVDDISIVTVETHIPGFNEDIYGKNVRLEFYDYIREEMKFSNTEELKAQIQKDCTYVEKYFK